MNSKTPLLATVLALALLTRSAGGDAGAGATSSGTAQSPKPAAKSADQPAVKPAPAPARTDAATPSAAPAKMTPPPSGAKTTPPAPVLLSLLDTDKDGRISSAEFIAYGKETGAPPGATKDAPDRSAANKSSTRIASATSDSAKPAVSDAHAGPASPAALPDDGILTSTSTRAGKYTAEVFENLDINHDKFLDQKELDALTGAHQISQP